MADLTIGIFLASYHTGASNEMIPAMLEKAQRRDVNVICFPGGRLNALAEYENQRNAVFDLASPAYLDGIVSWGSSLGGIVDKAGLDLFHRHHAVVPLVTIAHQIEGFPVVRADAYHGMYSLVEHMVTVHGFRRIAFIRGPATHQSAQERWSAYKDALESLGVGFDQRLCLGPYRWDSGTEAVRDLLDVHKLVPGTDFDALVTASDLLSFKAIPMFQARGYRVPQDIAVAGFNDITESRLSTPPMTTVAMPFRQEGERSIDILMDVMEGKEAVKDQILPTQLLIRQSCGCHSANLTLGRAGPALAPGRGEDWKDTFVRHGRDLLGLSPESAAAWLLPLVEALERDIRTMASPGFVTGTIQSGFLEILGRILERMARRIQGISEWQEIVSLLVHLAPHFVPETLMGHYEDLLHKVRSFLAEQIQKESDKKHWESQTIADLLRDTGRLLLESHSVEDLCQVLMERTPLLGIPCVWLVLDGRMVLAIRDGELLDTGHGGTPVEPGQLLPATVFPKDRVWALVVEPLYFHTDSLGYAVFDASARAGSVYEELRSYLSSALHGIKLFEEVRTARQAAERADNIKTRLLANVSHELRSPLNLILGHARQAEKGREEDKDLQIELATIRHNAEHQMRVVNDLLDITRAEIDELDLHREPVDLVPLLGKVFEDFSLSRGKVPGLAWTSQLPPRLPLVYVDSTRMRQVILNLLSNAARYTEAGSIELGAAAGENSIRIWVRDTGCGISPEVQERIFEPFISGATARPEGGGIGLGLSITRHMVLLHGGKIDFESSQGRGTTFTIHLPLPNLAQTRLPDTSSTRPVLMVIGHAGRLAPEFAAMAEERSLGLIQISHLDELEELLAHHQPRALAWDLSTAQPTDWLIVRHLRQHPALFQAPFMLYGATEVGLTSLVPRNTDQSELIGLIENCCPKAESGAVYVVDDEPETREALVSALHNAMPRHEILVFDNGEDALASMESVVPGLVVLDYVMPNLSGADVLDRMRADTRLRHIPALVLSNKVFDQNDIKRLEIHAKVVLQNKGVWTMGETTEAVSRLLLDGETQAVQTSALVKRAIFFLNQNYKKSLSRWQVAEAINVSEDYLSRVFNRELGISPWDYLNRYRVWQAGRLLVGSNDSVRNIALATGFSDQAYFSRVFRKITGMSPNEFRQKA